MRKLSGLKSGACRWGCVAVLLAATLVLGVALPAVAKTFPDIGSQPAEIQSAIDYVTEMGLMNGAADGNFHPAAPTARMDYARATVKLFKNLGEDLDPSIHFKDIKDSDPDYKYANLATKHGYLGPYPDGSFKPNEPVTTINTFTGIVVGLDLELPARHLRGLYPRGPEYQGYMIIAHDLHLKFRNTTTWPQNAYPRGEMAYTLQKADQLEEWRLDYVSGSFDWLTCQAPLVGPQRQKALDAAFSKIGYPYVWGGESDAERGYDCSGLTYFALFSVLGYPMMRTADDQARDGRYAAVGREQLIAGDPIFFFKDANGGPNSPIGHAAMYVGHGLFIHSTGSNAGVSVDALSGYWDEQFAWGKRVIAEPEPESFDTYLLLMNPGSTPATARLHYMLPSGTGVTRDVQLVAGSRKTVKVDDTLTNQEVSTTVETIEGELVAERSMYFDYRGRYPGGHDSPGATAPATLWYLPEGCTDYSFDTFILVQNPGNEAAGVTVTYLLDNGSAKKQKITVQPCSRYTIAVDSVQGLEKAEFSTMVESSAPVVVERSMYFDYKGISEGHNSPGATALSQDWFFAEGYTGGGFDSYLLLMNPSGKGVYVTLRLMAPDGKTESIKLGMHPHSRRTVTVDNIPGWNAREFSASVHASQPIAAERSMYFDYCGIQGGHDSLGTAVPSGEWFLAEGYTAGQFDTYVLLTNPSAEHATVDVRFMLNGGRSVDRRCRVRGHSRYTIAVDKIPGLSAVEVSTHVKSNVPVVAERSVYFRYNGVRGGTCAGAVGGPSDRWYFAEGYTGR